MLFFLSLFLTLALLAGAAPLSPDPATLRGHLDNGFSYIIRKNAEPPGRVSLRLHIDAGSLMEADDQRGLAHFLEHMVFNGTRSYSAAELVPKMQRLGIAFGAHANAYTSFDETVYMLDLPNIQEETLELAFTVMRDFADGALLSKEEIDKERGVILSEKTSRDSVGYRMMLRQFGYLLPESRLINRVPIGTEEVISKAPRERFVDFYRQYYTPKRMTFIVVGDIEPPAMEKRVREAFISLQNPTDPGPDPTPDTPPSGFGFRTQVFTDPELSSQDLSLSFLRPFEPEPDTRERRLAEFPLRAAHAILNRRFQIVAKEENSPLLGGRGSRDIYFNMIESGTLSVTAADGKWREALPVLEQEYRRLFQHGVTQAEIREVSANLLNAAEQAVERAPSRESSGIAMAYVQALNSGKIVTTPETDLQIVREALPLLTQERIHADFKEFWKGEDLSLILTATSAPEDAAETLKSIYQKSQQKVVSPPEESSVSGFAYTDFGPAGKVLTQKKIADLGITRVTFENDLILNLKKTDFSKNTISLNLRFGQGTLTLPEDQPGLDQFASTVFNAGGLGQHSEDDLQGLLAGRNVGTGLMIGPSSFDLKGRTTPEDLDLQLQLMTATLTDPGYRPEAERQFRMQLPMIYQQIRHTPSSGMLKMQAHLSGDDHRAVFPSQEQMASYTTADARAWLESSLNHAPLELSVVGDFKEEKVIEAVSKTLGALPKRPNQHDRKVDREVTLPQRPGGEEYVFPSQIPTAQAIAAWAIPTAYRNEKQARRFNLLARILSDRLREEIREKLGGSYSPRANAMPHPALNYGYLQASSTVKPEEARKYADLMVSLADDLARDGVKADELERARKPLQSNIEKSKRDNSYWLTTVLSGSSSDPTRLDLARNRDADYASITIGELNQLASQYLKKENSLTYLIIPQPSIAEENGTPPRTSPASD